MSNMLLGVEPLSSVSLKIKKTRKTVGISQKRLSKLAGMSQSTIARIESDIESLNPSYKTIYLVIDALQSAMISDENSKILAKTSKDIMHKHPLYVKPDDTIEKALGIIKNYDFPQLPVLNERMGVVGTVSQKKLLTLATESPEAVSKTKVKELLEAALPQVDKNTEVSRLKPILENFDAVLVMDGSKAVGIITIYDILKLL